MKAYIPTNIKTGQVYPAISEQDKAEWESDPMINGGSRKRYKFRETLSASNTGNSEILLKDASLPVGDKNRFDPQKIDKPKKETTPPPVEAKRVEDMPNEPN